MKAFFSDNAKERVKQAIVEAESVTSAEVVVSLKPRSASYRDIDYVVGVFCAFGVLCWLLFAPSSFDEDYFPVEVAASFVIGTLLSASTDPLKRQIVPNSRKSEEVDRTAAEVFLQLGVHRTRERNGVLVLVSAFERKVSFVGDTRIVAHNLGEPWEKAKAAVEQAVARGDLEAFARAVGALGPVLSEVFPRSEDDINELSDEVS